MKQLAVLPPGRLGQYEAFIESRVLELCYTAWDMAPFGGDLGWDGPPSAGTRNAGPSYGRS